MRGLALQRLPQTQPLRIPHAIIGSHGLLNMITVPGALKEEDYAVGHCHLKARQVFFPRTTSSPWAYGRMPPCIQAVNHLLIPIRTLRYTAFPSESSSTEGRPHEAQVSEIHHVYCLRTSLKGAHPFTSILVAVRRHPS
jgi:hypothetical protein